MKEVNRLRYLTAGESHGPRLTGIVEGLPAGLPVSIKDINRQLARRQGGYGRGGRMKIEKDKIEILAGVRFSLTTGAPLALSIENKDFANWKDVMSAEGPAEEKKRIVRPRPGHADLAGGIKYLHKDLRNVLERSSARETAMRVAICTLGRMLVSQFQVHIFSHILALGSVSVEEKIKDISYQEIEKEASASSVSCGHAATSSAMIDEVDRAHREGDSLGGVIEVIALNPVPGLGSHVQWDRRLDSRLAGALMSIQGVKGVEVGDGFASTKKMGSQVHDPIGLDEEQKLYRPTNRAGGLEGGMTNGEPIVLRLAMKPIPTLTRPLKSVDILSFEENQAAAERSDTCAVPAAAVVAEAIVAWELALAYREKFGGDSMEEMTGAYKKYCQLVEEYLEGHWKGIPDLGEE